MRSNYIRKFPACLDCGIDICMRGSRAERCVPCAKEWRRTWYLRYNPPLDKFCADCGENINHRSNSATRCAQCAKIAERYVTARRRKKPDYVAYIRTYGMAYRNRPDRIMRVQERRQTPEYKAQRRKYAEVPRTKELHAEGERRRKARKAGQLGVVTDRVKAMLAKAKHCGLCGAAFTKETPKHIDHVVPLAKGGMHEDANLQALCAQCNNRKYDKDPIVFARKNWRLL